jgi:hypothetical protein
VSDFLAGNVFGAAAIRRRHPREEVLSMSASLNRLALSATLHCLTGCAIGEVLGLVIGTALGWGNVATIALAVTLAFLFGYALTMRPLLRHGLSFAAAAPLALAADTLSIGIMEIVDNGIMLLIPGAMDAHLHEPLFWGSMTVALLVAGAAAYPVNRWLIARGKGHALVHAAHEGHAPAGGAGTVAGEPAAARAPRGHAGHGGRPGDAGHGGHGGHSGHGGHPGHAGHGAPPAVSGRP